MEQIGWDDFQKVVMVAGTITRAEPFPEARKSAYKVWVDFGPYGERKTNAQIRLSPGLCRRAPLPGRPHYADLRRNE